MLRYAAGVLIAKGFIDTDMGKSLVSDPDLSGLIDMALGTAAGAVTEWWYWLARKFGWSK